MNEPDDRTLVESVVHGGDPRAFAALYERHTPAMYGLALRLTAGTQADAEDIVHDAWIRAVERLDAFEWRSALRSWLCGFVVHRWRELRRGRARGPESKHHVLPAADPRLDAIAERVDLERAIRRLADGYREVLVLHDIQGFTHEEIAALLGIEAGTSKSQLSRARRTLRQSLNEPGGIP